MPIHSTAPELLAEQLIHSHGQHARQRVVDRMVLAIRDHDLVAAKKWEIVGQAVDDRLAA